MLELGKSTEKRDVTKERKKSITSHTILPTVDQLKHLLIYEAVRLAKGKESIAAKMPGISQSEIINSRGI